MTDEYEISDEPPRDSDGHPVHPERGHWICGATKSEKTTPTEHGRERDDYDYCLLAAGWGEDRGVGPCSKHPVTGEQWGESNPNFRHGAFSKQARGNLTEDERAAVEDLLSALEDPEEATGIVHELIADAYVKWNRSGDVRFLREIRQLLSEFNVAPSVEQLEVNASVETEHSLDDETREVVRDVLAQRREASDE